MPPGVGIPKALLRVLDRAADPEDRQRLSDLFEAANRAISALGEIDLSAYEPTGEETTDLSAWEDMAPIIGQTLSEVNNLLSVVDSRIPLPADPFGNDEDIDFFGDTFSEGSASEIDTGPGQPAEDGTQAAMAAIHGIASVLRMEVTTFGGAMRKPQIMANRWNLLDALEAFRGKFRAGVGEMVYAAASSLADVSKETVVPGYRHDIEVSVGLRRALSFLGPEIAKINLLAKEASNDGYSLRKQAARAKDLLDRLVKSKAWSAVRAADRQSLTKLRAALSRCAADPHAWPSEISKSIEGLDRFLESMSVINHRETLIIHDREALPRLRYCLEAARTAAHEGDESSAHLIFKDAMSLGWQLIGRDSSLDEVLRSARRIEIADLDSEDIMFWADSLLARLRGIPSP